MRTLRPAASLLLVLSFFALGACGDDTTGPEQSLQLSVEPSDQLRQVVDQAPTEFRWEMADREVRISNAAAVAGTVPLHLCGVAMEMREEDASVLGGACSDAVPLTGERLSGGVRSDEAFEGAGVPLAELGSEFFPVSDFGSPYLYEPDVSFVPLRNEVAAGMTSSIPAQDWSALTIYARPTSPDEADRVRPFALGMEPGDSTVY